MGVNKMEENIKILNDWEKKIRRYKTISLDEAKTSFQTNLGNNSCARRGSLEVQSFICDALIDKMVKVLYPPRLLQILRMMFTQR